MSLADLMRDRLTEAFRPRELAIEDESERHRGHAGYQEGGESHWRVRIRSETFSGMGRIERHRAVHAALGPEIIGRIHALALDLSD